MQILPGSLPSATVKTELCIKEIQETKKTQVEILEPKNQVRKKPSPHGQQPKGKSQQP